MTNLIAFIIRCIICCVLILLTTSATGFLEIIGWCICVYYLVGTIFFASGYRVGD